jgi:hypothetical protein
MTTISANGTTTTVYIWQDGSNYKFKYNIDGAENMISFPCHIQNTNTGGDATYNLKLYLTSDITFTDTSHFFICDTANIEFNGNRKTITISGVTNYPGLVENGVSGTAGKSLVVLRYIKLIGVSSTLSSGSGWIGQDYFGNGVSDVYITNCSSDAPISSNSGGIVGRNCGDNSGEVLISGCYSLGNIGASAGGICAAGGTLSGIGISNCYSEGPMGLGAGGILAASSGGTITINNCYSRGDIGTSGGGICGSSAGGTITINGSYSSGNIGTLAGGIFGAGASGTIAANECYTCGASALGATNTGGIYSNSSNDNLYGGANYSELNHSSSGWSDTNARNTLDEPPAVGDLWGITWCHTANNQPYVFSRFGLTPYSTSLTISYSETVRRGSSSAASILAPGYTYYILAVFNEDEELIPIPAGITINSSTGSVSVANNTPIGTYTLEIHNSINPYDSTEFEIIVDLVCYGVGTQVLIGEPSIEILDDIEVSTGSDEIQLAETNITRKTKIVSRYTDIASLRPGMLVKTLRHGYLPIESVGVKTIRTGEHPKTTIFRLPPCQEGQTELTVTGAHSILLPPSRPKLEYGNYKIQKHKLDGCRRVLAMDWPHAKKLDAGVVTQIYHLVLAGSQHRYAIWVNGGWLSETTSREHFKQYRFTSLI